MLHTFFTIPFQRPCVWTPNESIRQSMPFFFCCLFFFFSFKKSLLPKPRRHTSTGVFCHSKQYSSPFVTKAVIPIIFLGILSLLFWKESPSFPAWVQHTVCNIYYLFIYPDKLCKLDPPFSLGLPVKSFPALHYCHSLDTQITAG